MRDNDTFSWASYLVIILLTGCLVYVFVQFGQPIGTPKQPPPVPEVVSNQCGDIIRRCRAVADLDFDTTSEEGLCDERKGQQRIEAALGSPVIAGDCPKALQEMEANCPAGCRLAHDQNLFIPGKLRAQITDKANPAGSCHVHGEIALTIRGTCVR